MLLNLITHQRPDIDDIYLYIKDLLESKYQLLINKREKVGIANLKKASIDFSQTIDDVYKNLQDYNPKERRVLTVFDDMIVDMKSNEKLSPIVTDLFFRGIKLNISLVFISQPYFKMPKTIKLNGTH